MKDEESKLEIALCLAVLFMALSAWTPFALIPFIGLVLFITLES